MLGGSTNIKHLSDAALLDSIDVSVRPITMILFWFLAGNIQLRF